jgi:succinoglycan biosynthesis transport protein ExoP
VTPEYGRVAPSLLDYLHVLLRRKWIFLLAVVVVPAVAVSLSMREPAAYEASAQVLLNRQNLTESLTGVQAPNVDPARSAQTEAELARVPEVARRAIEAVEVRNLTPSELLKASSVSASASSDFLTFSVTHSDRDIATRLSTAYARAFTEYRHGLDMQELERVLEAARREIGQLLAAGLKGSGRYRSLVQLERQLATMEALEAPTAHRVYEADRATKVGPQTIRNGLLGLALGLVLGLVLAFLWDALDTRVRSVDAIRDALGLRLLGSLPAPPRQLRQGDHLVMMAAPMSREAEPFRVLRASFDFANADYQAQTIMVTSAVDGDGKSTTVANLAVALARAGRRVVLIDFDLRNPHLHRFFNLDERPGLIDVELGDVEFEDALRPVEVAEQDSGAEKGIARREGWLDVLPAGHSLQAPDELGAERAVARIVKGLRDRADFVLIDAAPLLPVGDAIALSQYVDALVLVIRLNTLHSSSLDDLRRILSSSPAQKLGFVLTGTERGARSYRPSHRYAAPERSGEGEAPVALRSSSAPAEIASESGSGRPVRRRSPTRAADR